MTIFNKINHLCYFCGHTQCGKCGQFGQCGQCRQCRHYGQCGKCGHFEKYGQCGLCGQYGQCRKVAKATKEAAKDSTGEPAKEAAGLQDRLFKTFQDVSRQDNVKKTLRSPSRPFKTCSRHCCHMFDEQLEQLVAKWNFTWA